MPKTSHTSYRIPEEIKHKLAQLAQLDGLTSTDVLIKLVLNEHRHRAKEIEQMEREKQK